VEQEMHLLFLQFKEQMVELVMVLNKVVEVVALQVQVVQQQVHFPQILEEVVVELEQLLQLMLLQHKEQVEEVVLILMFQIMVEQAAEVNLGQELQEVQDVQEQLILVVEEELVHTVKLLLIMLETVVQE
tara:strand:+ start:86 stop:475 length:390 start_codon:yes stop_codon:yes gene_type:complete